MEDYEICITKISSKAPWHQCCLRLRRGLKYSSSPADWSDPWEASPTTAANLVWKYSIDNTTVSDTFHTLKIKT